MNIAILMYSKLQLNKPAEKNNSQGKSKDVAFNK